MPELATSVTRVVNAPVDTVWKVVTDLDGAVDTLTGVTRIERLAGEGYAVGTRWRETRKLMGKEASEEMWVVEVEAPIRTVVKAHSNGMDYTSGFTLKPAPGGTLLEMNFAGVSEAQSAVSKVLGAVFGRLGVRITRKMMAADLADFAAKAERIAST
ncbi:SRPBCC family protein [Rhodococcus globerulus]|uniref:SRPBCC family protein n=1 Tax=Rhodococcus globerulus TaxID=33008 RepID=A0ABU4BMH3_RHOGO|nr:SRPBCC family protein [Rhodococcus globerulus]MDV6265431.1 SRPBCC family protein [Rhodococcus globerulus]